jgi:arylsulfatase A-like enzyme/cytochrome c-type biogenesis protein CcmH/NrfG
MQRNDTRLHFAHRGWHYFAACALAGVVGSGVGCHQHGQAVSPEVGPRNANVLLITLDTTRADHLSCYARLAGKTNAAHDPGKPDSATGQFANTPHLEALASRGVFFAHAIAQVPLTIPSHACILTGTYPTVNHVRGMGGFVLPQTLPTLATLTQAAAYATAAILGSAVLDRRYGFARGFTVYDDNIASAREQKLPGRYSKRPASVVTDHAIAWLEKNYRAGFFLWVHYYDPHAPYDPPEPFKHIYAKDPYSGEVAYVDQEVGRLLDWIDQRGLGSRTLVLAIGDHGEGLGEHGEKHHGIFLYDSTLHVPFIMAGPGVPAGEVVERQVRSIDLMPTVMGFLHLSSGPDTQGVSLWPLILHNSPVQTDYAYCETLYPRILMGWSELRAMHTGKWEFIWAPRPELYDLQSDPAQATNALARYPAQARQLQSDMWGVAGGPNKDTQVATVPMTPAERAKLESLGYVSAGLAGAIPLGTKAPDPKDYVGVLSMVEQAEDLLDTGSYQRAAGVMEKALRRDPTNPAVHLYLGTALELAGEYQSAIRVYQHAISMKIESDEVYSRLGKDCLHLNQLNDAVRAMARAAEMNPTDLDNLCRLGNAYLQLGRIGDAAKSFNAALAQSDQCGPAYDGLGLVAVAHGDARTAQQDFLRAIALDSADLEPVFNLGVIYQKTGDRQQALHYLTLFVEKASPQQYGALLPNVRAAIREMKQH